MTKICWKCGKPHEDGDAYCIHCGASFATDDMKYQTDGRTVSAMDGKAYLSAPPPKYKKSHKGIVIAVVAIIAVAVVAVLLLTTATPADVTYKDECTVIGKKAGSDLWVAGYDITLSNNTDRAINTEEIYFKLKIDGQLIDPYGKTYQIITPKGTAEISYAFEITESQAKKSMELVAYSELNVRHA